MRNKLAEDLLSALGQCCSAKSKGASTLNNIQQGDPQVRTPITTLFATVAVGAALSATGVVYAADDATLNQCWGETTKQFAQVDDGQPGLGEHSSSPPGFTPGEGGRQGVGNVSKGHGDLSAGGQGMHANAVGPQMGLESCDGPDVP
jgi:hypothetical protein